MEKEKKIMQKDSVQERDERKYTLGRVNLIAIGISFVVIVIGFLLMSGEPTVSDFNPDVFSTRRTIIGPMISFLGFIGVVVAIMYKPKKVN